MAPVVASTLLLGTTAGVAGHFTTVHRMIDGQSKIPFSVRRANATITLPAAHIAQMSKLESATTAQTTLMASNVIGVSPVISGQLTTLETERIAVESVTAL